MSCTAVLVPGIYLSIKALMLLGAVGATVLGSESYSILSKIDVNAIKDGTLSEDDIQIIQNELKINNFKNLQGEFITTFFNEETLLKTLDEYGDFNTNIIASNIFCSSDIIDLEFYKKTDNEPYIVKIRSKCDCECIIKNINEEYGLNVQEQNYNQLIERLTNENLQIENEEVLEDNTIVLTINLE